ncbi:MAG: hypothetical protein HUJ28_00665 [Chromatiales bacterium]|nr:hypothetical protein [Chromatiales bacterium]
MGLLDKFFGRRQVTKPASSTPAHPMGEVRRAVEPLLPGDVGEFVKVARIAWEARDFERARLMYQKSAYAASVIRDPATKEQVNAMLRSEQARYVVDDPLFDAILTSALKVICASPGILQSELYKHVPYEREQTQWALYYGEVLGRVRREKKGRSYALTAEES